MKISYFMAAFLFLFLALPVFSEGQANAAFRSAEVHPDGSITFRYIDAAASKVSLHLEGVAQPQAMAKDAAGVWSITTTPLAPEMYSYHFEADGQIRLDPANTNFVPNMLFPNNRVLVTGATPQLWEKTAVPHGVLHHHFYSSKVVKGLSEGQSDYFVYTPPNYDPQAKKSYPVLYLLHGWTDTAEGWSGMGYANLILDNLIAQGKAKPMIVVMPLGYGEMSFVTSGHDVWDHHEIVDHNVEGFSKALLTEVVPQVEATYHASKNRDDRAIAGLSMGGLESLTIGLNHPDQFAWVGAFSSAVHDLAFDKQFAGVDSKSAPRRLLWIACGTSDALIAPNRKLVDWLKSKSVPVTGIETPGLHTWLVWRDNLSHFAPLLFQEK